MLQRCWALLRSAGANGGYFRDQDGNALNKCQTSHVAREMAAEKPRINSRIQASAFALGLKLFPPAVRRHRDQLRQEGIVLDEGVTL